MVWDSPEIASASAISCSCSCRILLGVASPVDGSDTQWPFVVDPPSLSGSSDAPPRFSVRQRRMKSWVLCVRIWRSQASHSPSDSPANRARPRWASSSVCWTMSLASMRGASSFRPASARRPRHSCDSARTGHHVRRYRPHGPAGAGRRRLGPTACVCCAEWL